MAADRPISELFAVVSDWCLARGLDASKAVNGLLKADGPDGIAITLNCTAEPRDGLEAFSMKLEQKGWPVAVLNPYGGAVMITTEAALIAAFKGVPGGRV